jgi:hypothetical protein
MNITDRLKLELAVREAIQVHGDEFYIELFKVLEKIQAENDAIPPVGRYRMVR